MVVPKAVASYPIPAAPSLCLRLARHDAELVDGPPAGRRVDERQFKVHENCTLEYVKPPDVPNVEDKFGAVSSPLGPTEQP